MEIIVYIYLILATFVLFTFSVSYVYKGIKRLSILLSNKRYSSPGVSENPVEMPVEEDSLKPRYDVEAFRKRMDKMRFDEDGLYTPQPKVEPSTFTGVEIITPDAEKDMERKWKI